MLALSRRQTTILFLLIVSFVVALVASLAIIHATNPDLWKHFSDIVPNVLNHY